MNEIWSKFEAGTLEELRRFLAESPRDGPMRIVLKGEGWGVAACEAIATAGVGQCLRFLCVRGTLVGDAGVLALLETDAFASLKSTCLERSGITDFGVTFLAKSPYVQELGELCLGNRLGVETGEVNQIGDDGAMSLAQSIGLTKLRDLDLGYTDVGDRGFEALVASPNLRLQSIIAWGTRLTREAWMRIKARIAEDGYCCAIHTDFDERIVEY